MKIYISILIYFFIIYPASAETEVWICEEIKDDKKNVRISDRPVSNEHVACRRLNTELVAYNRVPAATFSRMIYEEPVKIDPEASKVVIADYQDEAE